MSRGRPRCARRHGQSVRDYYGLSVAPTSAASPLSITVAHGSEINRLVHTILHGFVFHIGWLIPIFLAVMLVLRIFAIRSGLILVIEETRIAEILREALSRAGFAVDSASRCAEGREALSLTAYDAAVLDLGLPDGDGRALLTDLQCSRNKIPVLVLTARDVVEDRVSGLDAGADEHLVKPFATAEVIAHLRALLTRPWADLFCRRRTCRGRIGGFAVAGKPQPRSLRASEKGDDRFALLCVFHTRVNHLVPWHELLRVG